MLLESGLGVDDVVDSVANLPSYEIDQSVWEAVTSEFGRTGWAFEAKLVAEDSGYAEREEKRLLLDKTQAEIASEEHDGILVVTGPAGSGKSLVLIERAKLLSKAHPDWAIQLVCYNRGLVPYLKAQVAEIPNVSVDTFTSWLRRSGYKMNTSNCVSSSVGLDRIRREGIDKKIDALLVDEFQDFCPAWLELLFDSVTDGRGGVIVAGDDQQSLYREFSIEDVGRGRILKTRRLEIPYRSTRQILEAVSILDPEQAIPGLHHAPEGEPVELVWCVGGLEEKGKAICHLIDQHRELGKGYADFAVLATSNYMLGPIAGVLQSHGIRAKVLYSSKISEDDDPWSNSVKLSTIHTAKGLEYSIAFVVGLDELKEPGTQSSLKEIGEAERFVRVNLVGPTRAKDLLYILASKDNTYIRRVKEVPSGLLVHRWPEDYLEVDGG